MRTVPDLPRESSTLPDAPADLLEAAVADRFDVVGLALPKVRTPVCRARGVGARPGGDGADRHVMRP